MSSVAVLVKLRRCLRLSFNKDDLALFLPTRNPNTQVFAAFNTVGDALQVSRS